MSKSLGDTAIKLGKNEIIMDSYWAYHEREQNWFFSPNPNLDQATRRPSSFDNWESWDVLSSKQKMTLASLAGFHYSARDIIRNSNHFTRLKDAYTSKWKDDLYSIFWSNEGSDKLWLCNVFVGDAIYLYNNKSIIQGNNHYYDPGQIKNDRSSLIKRESYKDVKPGDIVVFGTTHVEIITDIQNNWIADDGFCSVGAGRGGNRYDMGDVRCDSDSWYIGGSRELKDSNNTYYYIS